MELKMCSCHMCKRGRHSKWGNFILLHSRRKYRRKVKRLLKQGKWEEAPVAVSVPYTD